MRPSNPAGEGRPGIVIPTIRSSEFFSSFLDNWNDEFLGCHLIIIEDKAESTLSTLLAEKCKEYTYELYSWKDIDEDLKEDSWIIPRKTDCVRNYGYLMAHRNKPLFIVTLDDDLEPDHNGHISQFYYNLFDFEPITRLDYFSTMSGDVKPRGYIKPTWHDKTALYNQTPDIKVSHGCWSNVPDLDAHTQLTTEMDSVPRGIFYQGVIPKGSYFSMCGMNLAWKPEMTEYMYFPLMGKYSGYEIDRSGDIYAGYYVKKVCDKNNWGITSGKPICHHTRASNPWTNLIKEERFWDYQSMMLHKLDYKEEDDWDFEFLKKLASYVPKKVDPIIEYFKKLGEAYVIWKRLVNDYSSDS